jgi:hypothetical protein
LAADLFAILLPLQAAFDSSVTGHQDPADSAAVCIRFAARDGRVVQFGGPDSLATSVAAPVAQPERFAAHKFAVRPRQRGWS